jgi:hypothetical protein
VTGKINEDTARKNMQSEIIFIAKLGGVCVSVLSYIFWIVRPMAIFNERQKQNKHDIEELKKFKDIFLKVQIEHDNNTCKAKRK